jgi:hypothetical protein
MSDTSESQFPFGSFPTTGGFEMLEKMWRMMQVPGLGGGALSPASMMSDMMTPMTNIDELDKRITDMRAVEQWLKLNLNLLQSAIQALEVQRATLATLKAFGAFAQTSMEQATSAPEVAKAFVPPAAQSTQAPTHAPTQAHAPAEDRQAAADAASAAAASIDPTPWWNLLQAQFNQIAAMALAPRPVTDSSKTASAQPAAPAAAAKAPAKTAARPVAKKASVKKTHASTTGPHATGAKGAGSDK